jgi:hypothetical protein
MIIYNVTVNIEDSVHDDWLQWMKKVHIPEVMSTGCFVEYRFARVMVEEESGTTYSIQYLTKNMDSLMDYRNNFAQKLQADTSARYGNQLVAFRTLLELID